MGKGYYRSVRFLGVDYGAKRIGLAISDATAMLARPWQVLPSSGDPQHAAAIIADVVPALMSDDDGLDGIVVGLPRRLDGRDTDATGAVRLFAQGLHVITALDVFLQDERLTSVEA